MRRFYYAKVWNDNASKERTQMVDANCALAGGYDVILVETVGVGQSETMWVVVVIYGKTQRRSKLFSPGSQK